MTEAERGRRGSPFLHWRTRVLSGSCREREWIDGEEEGREKGG